MRYVFIDADGVIVNVIEGVLSEYEASRLLADYRVLFGATSFIVVAPDVMVWSGGSYDATSGVFSPPPTPEPEPEPIVEETMNDDAPII
jgi:hypothetical protein